MKMAYVTTYNSSDIQAWSGTGYHLHKALEECGFQTKRIDDLRDMYRLVSIGKKLLYTKALSKRYLRDREPLSLRSYAAQVERALASMDCDVIFSPGTIPVAYLRTDKPVILWSDSTFAGVLDFYPTFSNLCRETILNGHRAEQLALSKCQLAIFSSDWAADTAIRHYDVDPKKVKVVPFGANIDCNRGADAIRRIVSAKSLDTCKLLFVGVDWLRKGGDIALAVAQGLNRRGLRTELHIVGCHPPHDVPSFVTLHGYVSKKTEEGRRILDRLFAESHFLIVPSRAECFGLVYAEASSFGLPSLATKVGGIPTAVRDAANGYTFALDDDPERYCDYVTGVMASRAEYERLSFSSFREYKERLNWTSAGKRARELIFRACSQLESAAEHYPVAPISHETLSSGQRLLNTAE